MSLSFSVCLSLLPSRLTCVPTSYLIFYMEAMLSLPRVPTGLGTGYHGLWDPRWEWDWKGNAQLMGTEGRLAGGSRYEAPSNLGT